MRKNYSGDFVTVSFVSNSAFIKLTVFISVVVIQILVVILYLLVHRNIFFRNCTVQQRQYLSIFMGCTASTYHLLLHLINFVLGNSFLFACQFWKHCIEHCHL